LRYRADIDGLRALAIIPVVLFHAKITGFTGGFVGVDIFFVISGFLIASIIYREVSAGTFSLLTFWERRARRIIPALFVMTGVTIAAGYFIILYPIDFIDLGQSAFAQALFLANIFFMRKNSYFAGSSESMPLLHTWSLSVEEQFYIGFPILLVLIWKFWKRALLPLLTVFAFASLAFSYHLISVAPGVGFTVPFLPNVWDSALNSAAGFYLLPARAFELLIGAMLAITAFSISRKKIAEVVSLTGLAMIVYAIFTFTDTTPFPGVLALIPTLGAAMIILANTNHRTFVGAILSFPVFVWVGLISYSLYLWHWPILVLSKQYLNRIELTSLETGSLIILSFVCAYLSYRFIETPFRKKQLLTRRTSMLLAGFVALAIIASVGLLIERKNGFPQRVSTEARLLSTATIDFGPRRSECFVNSFTLSNEPCLLGTQNREDLSFVLWGDSHAGALLPFIDSQAKAQNVSGASFISAGCMPISGTEKTIRIEKCEDVKRLARTFIREHSIAHVVLVSRWSAYPGLILKESDAIDPQGTLSELERSQFVFETAFETMTNEFQSEGVTVHIVKQVPQQIAYDVRKMFYDIARESDTTSVDGILYSDYMRNQSYPSTFFDEIAAQENVKSTDPSTVLCPDKQTCILKKNDVIIYQDADHLNKTGAFLLAPVFTDFFESLP
jgi:peptidoglycan/LPS O-acetylase OafA/YrhL